MAEEFTEKVKTDDGYHLTKFLKVSEVGVLRRDDLRGCWEVNGEVYGSREEAFTAAEEYLSVEPDIDPATGVIVLPDNTAPIGA